MKLNGNDTDDNHYEQYNDNYVEAKENDDNLKKTESISRETKVHVQLIGNQSKNLNNFQIEYIDENEIDLDVDDMKNDPINIRKNKTNVQSEGIMEDSHYVDVAPSIEIEDEENDTETSIVFGNQYKKSNNNNVQVQTPPPPPNDDEYQLFGLYIASQLRKLPLRRAESSKCRITEFLSQERIDSIENTN